MLLDALTYVIEADNSDLDREVNESERQIDQLGDQARQTEREVDSATTGMSEGFNKVRVAVAAALTIAAAAGAALVSQRAEAAKMIGQTARTIGSSVEDVDAFGTAIEMMGGDAQGARDSLVDLAEAVGQGMADASSQQGQAFAKLGVNLTDANGKARDTMAVMLDLSAAVAGMSKQEAIFQLKGLGVTDNRTIDLLTRGRKEVGRMIREQKKQGVVTEATVKAARDYNQAMTRFHNSTAEIGDALLRSLSPALQTVSKWFAKTVDWLSEHPTALKIAAIGLAGVITAVLIPATVAWAAANLAATWEYLAIAAAIAAVSVAIWALYDDIMHFMRGQKSMVGLLMDNFPILNDLFRAWVDTAKMTYHAIAGIFDLLTGDFDGFVEHMKLLWEEVKDFTTHALGVITRPTELLIAAFFNLLDAGQKVAQALPDAFAAMGEAIRETFDALLGFIEAIWGKIEAIYNKTVGLAKSAVALVTGGDGGSVTDGMTDAEINEAGADGYVPDTPRWIYRQQARKTLRASGQEVTQDTIDRLADALAAAKKGGAAIGTMNANPLNATTSTSITNQAITETRSGDQTSLSIGEVHNHITSTDPRAAADEVTRAMNDQLQDLQADGASGVAR